MTALRHLAQAHRRWAALVIALALAMKVLLPAGYMPTFAGNRIALRICSGTQPAPTPAAMHGAMAGMTHEAPAHGHGEDRPEQPCAFAGLTAPSLAAADPVLLVLAILFVMARGLAPAGPPPAFASPRLRPPLRAPPPA